MRILIIDDDRAHAESLADLVEVLGHEAHAAQSLEDARWLVELLRFDLALLDFDMPELTGPEVATRLAESQPGLPSVILSARPPQGRRREELLGLPFLSKPLLSETLQALLESIARLEGGGSLMRRSGYAVIKYY